MTLAVGQVLYWKNFKFHDGGEDKNKLFIVLSVQPNVLIVKTTSVQSNRQATHGCKENGKYYMIPTGKPWFKKDTWILLSEFKINTAENLKSRIANNDITILTTLPQNETNAIKNCLRYSDDVPEIVAKNYLQ